MAALAVYRCLHDAGVRLTTDGGTLRAYPKDRLTEDLRAMVRANKPELLELLVASHETTTALLAAAMTVCDRYGDGETARAEMRADCLALPPHLQADLLEHFKGKP